MQTINEPVSSASSFARPRPPGPPYPEMGVLASCRFDNTNLLAGAGSEVLKHETQGEIRKPEVRARDT